MNIGDVLKAWRHHRELSLKDAAEQIGISLWALHNLENGKYVSKNTKAQVQVWLLG